jgi:hypothetical protein
MTKKIILSWESHTLKQTHNTRYSTLIVSGCSFTDCGGNTEHPITWPGYLLSRAGFDQVIDVSHGGAGNEYIATSIVNQIESMSANELSNSMVIIIWSGIGRKENLIQTNLENAQIDNFKFEHDIKSQTTYFPGEALRSWKNIVMMQNYLENKNLPFGFSFFVNTFDPPFLPRRMASNVAWQKSLLQDKIDILRKCNWIHDHKQSLFEYCFEHDFLESDLFHPNCNGRLARTDQILLPGLTKMGLVKPVDQ